MATIDELLTQNTKKSKYKKKKNGYGLLGSQSTSQQDYPGLLNQQQDYGLLSSQGASGYGYGYDMNELRNRYAQYIQAMRSQQEDAQDQRAKTFLAKKAASEGYSYATSPNISGQDAWNTPTATENYIDSGSMSGGQSAANTPTGSEAYIDSGQMGEGASNSSSSDGGSYLGAATGAMAGYGQGTASEYTNPDYTSGEDDYGKYDTMGTGGGIKGKNGKVYYDKRGQIGHTIGGGFLGYWGGSPLVSSVARWSDPYLEDMTRSVLNIGDKFGGVTGAMLVDPIGAIASGKYSTNDILKSGLLSGLGPLNALNSGDSGTKNLAQKVMDPGGFISDAFGW